MSEPYSNPVGPNLAPQSRQQVTAVAEFLWRLFVNSLRTFHGRLELVSRIFFVAGGVVGAVGLGGAARTRFWGCIFLRYADHEFALAEKRMPQQTSGRRKIGMTDYQAQGVLYIPEKARFGNLLNLPEGTDIGKATVDCMDRSV